jgi:hypothetical protein
VDLDYKAISNAGTWMIGRLQTDQDKNRLIDGLRGADGGVDVAAVERTISALGKRQFVLRTAKSSALPLFTTRWAMSYLAGPLTREQIATLMTSEKAALESAQPAATQPASSAGTQPAATAGGATLADDESSVPPSLPSGMVPLTVRPAAPWLDKLGIDPSSNRLEPALKARLNLLFDDTKADLRHAEEWEAIIPLTGKAVDLADAVEVDFDDRDFTDTIPSGSVYVLPEFEISAALIKDVTRDLRDRLYTQETLQLSYNPDLKLWSRPGEDPADFGARCKAAADDAADAEAAQIRAKLERKRDALAATLAKEQDRVAELETQAQGARNKGIVDIGTSILGGLLGGRRSTSGLASAARKAASANKSSSSVNARLDTARNRVAESVDDLATLEAEISSAVIEIDDEWTNKAATIESVDIPLEKTDITVADISVVWLPKP